jgi:hypothetical protein
MIVVEPEKKETKKKRRPPASLFALGHAELPDEVEAQGTRWVFSKLFKHDFFAATGLYQHAIDPTQYAVLKVQRTASYFGFPMRWLGRKVASREIRIYKKLQGIRGVPEFLGEVGETGFLHAFIPGVDLHSNLPLTEAFFNDLHELFEQIHRRQVAYVDSNKRENILYGEDGRPWLIDFQISYELPRGEESNWVYQVWLRRFQRADWYHFYKHKTRLIPTACDEADFERAEKRGMLHRVHRFFAKPMIRWRRRILSRYDLARTK